jgi:hypothetical protein
VVVIDAKKDGRTGLNQAWTHNGTRPTGRPVIDIARQAEALGAGEIVINSIDNDGMMKGYDLALAIEVRKAVRLPVTFPVAPEPSLIWRRWLPHAAWLALRPGASSCSKAHTRLS